MQSLFRTVFSLLFLILIPALLWAQVEQHESLNQRSKVSITLREEAFLSKDYITLSDVAEIACENSSLLGELKSIKIGATPIPGQSRFLSVDLVKMYLRNRVDLKDVEFLGAHGVKVFPETIKISKELILAHVKDYIKRNLADPIEFSLELDGHFREFEVYKGNLEFEVGISGKLASVRITRNGKPQRTLYLPIKVRITGDFVVAKKPIPAKRSLSEADVMLQETSVEESLADLPISNLASLSGKRAKISILPGQVIRASMVEEVPLVGRGDRVTILLENAPLLISTYGRAEEEGATGKVIRVVNLSSRKTIYAEIVGEKLVKVCEEGR